MRARRSRMTARIRRIIARGALWSFVPRLGRHRGGAPRTIPRGSPNGPPRTRRGDEASTASQAATVPRRPSPRRSSDHSGSVSRRSSFIISSLLNEFGRGRADRGARLPLDLANHRVIAIPKSAQILPTGCSRGSSAGNQASSRVEGCGGARYRRAGVQSYYRPPERIVRLGLSGWRTR